MIWRLLKTLDGGIKLKINIHGLNTIFLSWRIEIFGSAIEYYFNGMVELEKCILIVERLKNEFSNEINKKYRNLSSKIISREFNGIVKAI